MTLRLSDREAHALGLAKAPAKYGNDRPVVDGIRFDSTLEANHWQILKRRERAGEIRNLERQVRYPIIINGIKVCTYVADMTYWDIGLDARQVIDVKGFRTPSYRIKARLMEACWGITIVEVTA